jgi:hypothetical protein
MGWVIGVGLAVAVVIYVVMHFWWVLLALGLAWAGWRLVRNEMAASEAQRVAAALEVDGLRQRADEGHAAYMRGEATF